MHKFPVPVAIPALLMALLATSPLLQAAPTPTATPTPAAAPATRDPGKDSGDLLRRGLFEEEANRDLDKAAAAYMEVLTQYDLQRRFGGTALFRLAEIRVKQGNRAEGVALYQRVLAEFPQDDTLAGQSRSRLAALDVPAAPAVSVSGTLDTDPVAVTREEADELVRVRELIQNSPDLLNTVAGNGSPFEGYTPLTRAAVKGWAQVTAFLLDHGSRANGTTNGGEPLHLAAAGGYKKVVELLFAHQADPNAATPDGWTALHAACVARRMEIIRLLLEKGAKANGAFSQWAAPLAGELPRHGWGPAAASPGAAKLDVPEATPLLIALDNRDSDTAILLLEHGADPNLYVNSSMNSPFHSTPLLSALFSGQEAMAKLLLARGAKPDTANSVEANALTAAASGTPLLVPLLLERGVPQTTTTDGQHWTPLSMSIYLGGATQKFDSMQRRTVEIPPEQFHARLIAYEAAWTALLAHGADINVRMNGQTPLFMLVVTQPKWSREVADWLLAHGADINARDNNEQTLLHVIAKGAGPLHETLAWLLEHGADPKVIDKERKTPLHLLVDNPGTNLREDAALLLAHGADINAQDKNRQTPLHRYCSTAPGRVSHAELCETVAWLVTQGADVDSRDAGSYPPFQSISDDNQRWELQQRFYYPQMIPRVVKAGEITAFLNFKRRSVAANPDPMDTRTPFKITAAGSFDAAPSMAGLLAQALRESGKGLFTNGMITPAPAEELTVRVHRATSTGEGVAEVAKWSVRFDKELPDTSQWPALRWGDVVLFTSESAGTNNLNYDQRLLPAIRKSRRAVEARIGDRISFLILADPAAYLAPRKDFKDTGICSFTGKWSPALTPLPAWTCSGLVSHLVENEPRAQLDAVRILRPAAAGNGEPQTWTIDLRATGAADAEPGPDGQPSRVKKLSGYLADGDQLEIPMRPAKDVDALATRQGTISYCSQGRIFGRPVFTRLRNELAGHTLAELIAEAYLEEPLISNPDFSNLIIHRLKTDGSGEEEHLPVNFTAALLSIKQLIVTLRPDQVRAYDTPLQWGDSVEIRSVTGTKPDEWSRVGDGRSPLGLMLSRTIAVNRIVQSAQKSLPLPEERATLEEKFLGYSYYGGIGGPSYLTTDQAGPGLSFTARSLLENKFIKPDNVARFVIFLGDQKREYDTAQLQAVNPWLPSGCRVEIQQFSP